MSRYAEVLLPLPLHSTFSYEVPFDLAKNITVGSRVVVPFGKKKYYTGIVKSLSDIPPGNFEVKEIGLVLDNGKAIVKRPQLQFWDWIADYYLCSAGDVFKAAVPSGLKIESETFIEMSPDYEESPEKSLSQREALIVQALDHAAKRLSIADIEKMTGLKGVGASVGPLLQKGAVIISEKLVERYTPRRIRCVRLTCSHGDNDRIRDMFMAVKGAPKQEKALLALMELSGSNRKDSEPAEVTTEALRERAEVSNPIIHALAEKGIVEFFFIVIFRFK